MAIGLNSHTDGISGAIQVAGNDVVPFNTSGLLTPQIQTLTTSVASNALTVNLASTNLTFKSTAVGGNPTTIATGNLSLTIPFGATLGTVSGQSARLLVLAINNAGTVVLGIVNSSITAAIDETTNISTTAISSSATSNTTVYTNSALTGVAYRVVGFIDISEATAGTWVSSPTNIIGAGGNSLTTLGSTGYGQTWQNVTASRAAGTTYYNTTGKPIMVSAYLTSSSTANAQITVNGVVIGGSAYAAGGGLAVFALVPPGATYVAGVTVGTPAVNNWSELR